MLFRAHLYDDIRSSAITVAFRRWKRPTVSENGTLRTPIGVLHIDELVAIEPDDITPADARAAGFATPDAALASLTTEPGRQLYRIRFHLAGDDPRIELRETAELTDADRAHTSTTNWTAGTARAPPVPGRGTSSTSSTSTPANDQPTSPAGSTSTSTS